MTNSTRLSSSFADFTEELSRWRPANAIELTLKELLDGNKPWGEWQNSAGVYYFVETDRIVYVGRALATVGLGTRIHSQIHATGDARWDRVIKNPEVIIGVIEVPKDLDFMASALELFLIKQFKPEFNKRRQ